MRCRVPQTLWGAIAILGASLCVPLASQATLTSPVPGIPQAVAAITQSVSFQENFSQEQGALAQDPDFLFDLNPAPVAAPAPAGADYLMDLNRPLTSSGENGAEEQWPGYSQGFSPVESTCVKVPADRQGQGSSLEDPLWNLVALMPSTHMVQTLRRYPTFFWYVPPTTARYAQFSLYTTDRVLRPDRLVYRTNFRIDGQGGIASVTVPARMGVPPLERDRPYGWSLSLYCPESNSPPDPTGLSLGMRMPQAGGAGGSGVIPEAPGSFDGGEGDGVNRLEVPITEQSISGFIRRIATPAGWSLPSTKASGVGVEWLQPYEASGLWWDAMATIATQCCCHGEMNLSHSANPWVQSWRDVLADLKLEPLALQPLLAPCRR